MSEQTKKVTNKTRATAANATAGLTTYVAGVLSVKHGVPMEVTLPAVGLLFAWLGRWAAKLNPHD